MWRIEVLRRLILLSASLSFPLVGRPFQNTSLPPYPESKETINAFGIFEYYLEFRIICWRLRFLLNMKQCTLCEGRCDFEFGGSQWSWTQIVPEQNRRLNDRLPTFILCRLKAYGGLQDESELRSWYEFSWIPSQVELSIEQEITRNIVLRQMR